MAANARLCFWNMLADGMSNGEFATWGGDEMLTWSARSGRVLQILAEGLAKCDIFAVVECDRAMNLYQRLLPHMPDLRALWVIAAAPVHPLSPSNSKVKGVSNARALSVTTALHVALSAGCAGLPSTVPSLKQLKELDAASLSSMVPRLHPSFSVFL